MADYVFRHTGPKAPDLGPEHFRLLSRRSMSALTVMAFLFIFSSVGVVVYEASFASGTPEIASGISGMCLNDLQNNPADGAPAVISACNGSAGEQFVVSGQQVKKGSQCLAPNGGGTTNGTPVHLWTCDTAHDQSWSYTGHSLINVQANKCLDDPFAGGSGTQLQIWSCNTNVQQIWKTTFYTPPPPPPTPTPTPPPPTPTPTPNPTPVPTHNPTPTPTHGGGGGSGGGGSGSGGGGSQPTPTPAPSSSGPGAPPDLNASTSGNNAVVNLNWTDSTDPVGIAYYEVDRSVDQVNWTVTSNSDTSDQYTDNSTDYNVHYYYRVKAVDTTGAASPYSTVDIETPGFKSNLTGSGSTTLTSNDGLVQVVVPSGAINGQVDCSVGSATNNSKLTSNQHLVIGPYQLVCKDSQGNPATSFSKTIAWSFNLKHKLGGLENPLAFSSDQSGNLTAINGSTYSASSTVIQFSSETTNPVLILATATPPVPWNAIALILFVVGVIIALAVLILHRQQKVSYNDYLRSKYYNF